MTRPPIPKGGHACVTLIASAVLSVTAGGMAVAGDWAFTPSVGLIETFTDNANGANDGEDRNSDLISTLTPSFSLVGTGARLSANINYSVSKNFRRQNTGNDSTNHSLAATGNAELLERIIFLESSATITRQIIDNRQASSNTVAGQDINRSETRTVNMTPVIRHRFGNWASTEAKTRLSVVSNETDTVSDTKTFQETITVSSGRKFPVFPWSLVLLKTKTINDNDSPSREETRADTSFSYVISPKLSLLGGVGYENIDDTSLDEEPNGFNWNLGFAAQPSSRTSFRLSGGIRNETSNIDFSASHQLSARTAVTASFSQTIQTSENIAADNAAFLVTDPLTGGLVDSRTGLPFSGDDPFGLEEETFRQDRFQLSFSGSRKRNRFSGSAFYERRDIEADNVIETGYGGSLSLSRQLTRKTNGSLSVNAGFTDLGTADNRTSLTYGLNGSLTLSVIKDVNATLSYSLTVRNENNAPEDFLENSVSVGLSRSF